MTTWPASNANEPTPPPIITMRPATQMPIAEPIPDPPGSIQRARRMLAGGLRLLGLVVLAIAIPLLAGHLASTAFYHFSDSWIVPTTLSPSDEKVVALQVRLATRQRARDRVAVELQQAERELVARQTYQAELVQAIKRDLEDRRRELGRLREELAAAAAQVRAAEAGGEDAPPATTSRPSARGQARSGKPRRAPRPTPDLALAERQAELEQRVAELEAQARSLDTILGNAGGSAAPVLDLGMLRIKQQHEASRLELAKATDATSTLRAALVRHDQLVAALEQSPYLRAVRDEVPLAYVPHDGASSIEPGTSLYACRLGMLFCSRVGEVREVLPDEVQFKHPHRDRHLRGRLAVLGLDAEDADAASADVLFVGGSPLLF